MPCVQLVIIYFTTLIYRLYIWPQFGGRHVYRRQPDFPDAEKARKWLEALLWPEGPICPHCGLIGAAYKLNGKKQRAGLYECKGCSEQFTVTIGTVFERSH